MPKLLLKIEQKNKMSQNTKTKLADHTFNPWWGCSKISPACDNCYAETLDKLAGGDHWGAGKPRKHTSIKNWLEPYKWNRQADAFMAKHKRRQRVFCASMGDVFDNEVDPRWRIDLFALIATTPNLDWLILTKRIGNAKAMVPAQFLEGSPAEGIPANVWLGASICNQEEADRDIPKLLAVPAAKRFLSVEPMLGAINIGEVSCLNGCGKIIPTLCNGDKDMCCPRCGTYTTSCLPSKPNKPLEGIDWVICGGESGDGPSRPMHPDWVRSLRNQCEVAGVPFLFQQWGEWSPRVNSLYLQVKRAQTHVFKDGLIADRIGIKNAGRLLDGVEHSASPTPALCKCN